MTPGREYGIGKYGRNTYDHWRQASWVPEPITPGEIWVPITQASSSWESVTAPSTEIWVPEPVTSGEIWIPDV